MTLEEEYEALKTELNYERNCLQIRRNWEIGELAHRFGDEEVAEVSGKKEEDTEELRLFYGHYKVEYTHPEHLIEEHPKQKAITYQLLLKEANIKVPKEKKIQEVCESCGKRYTVDNEQETKTQ